jgi:ectoine hydroxylase-related dioxygenase (phytanoyl-CoA dioxygenase family)
MNALELHQGRLSDTQVQQYLDQGYLFPISVFDTQEAAQMRAELERIESEWNAAELPRSVKTYKRVNAHAVMPFAYDLAQRAELLDVVEGILGPNILIYGVEFFIKEPKTPHYVSMHQDLTYWGLGDTQKMVTAWLALSPATVESGCMEFVRASHKLAIQPHKDTFAEDNLLSRGQEVEVTVAESERTAIELAPGQMSLHHGMTIHGSGPNNSNDRRIGVVIRYMSTDVKPQNEAPDYAVLARGEYAFDAFHPIPRPASLFHPDALQYYDEVRAAQATVKLANTRVIKDPFYE